MSENNNARCPLCGSDFFAGETHGETVCPNCGKPVSVVRAKKYFSSIFDNKEEFKEAHGEDFHKEMLLLDEAYGYINAGDYENAEKKIDEAFSLTDSDYKVYMAMVALKTKNYTDLKDDSHLEYINKAIALADSDEKKDIKNTYRPYYRKRQLSDAELGEFKTEEAKYKKGKLESELKKLIPFFDNKQKKQKIYLILFIAFFAVGMGVSAGFLFSDYSYVAMFGFASAVAGFILFRTWFLNRDTLKGFNALLDLYDALDGAGCLDETATPVYDCMQKLCDKYRGNESSASMMTDVSLLIDSLIVLDNDKVNTFLLSSKYFSQFVTE